MIYCDIMLNANLDLLRKKIPSYFPDSIKEESLFGYIDNSFHIKVYLESTISYKSKSFTKCWSVDANLKLEASNEFSITRFWLNSGDLKERDFWDILEMMEGFFGDSADMWIKSQVSISYNSKNPGRCRPFASNTRSLVFFPLNCSRFHDVLEAHEQWILRAHAIRT